VNPATAPAVETAFHRAVSGIIVKDGWRERLESLVGRRVDAWIVAGLTFVVAVSAVLLWSRGGSPQIAPPAEPASVASAPASSGETPAVGQGAVLVHVAGAVREPGVYGLDEGARVADAIDLAGGARSRADLDALNLAMVVTDGMQVLVPVKAGDPAPSAPALESGMTQTPTPAPVNINSADQIALETVPGIGPVTAQAVIEYREQIGPFDSVEELIDVSGIGPATLESIRPYVTV
jgi:competence protein ComEA